MNDIHLTFFILLALFSYIKYKHTTQPIFLLITGVVTGLAVSSKWTGIFIWGAILIFEVLRFLAIYFNSKGRILNQQLVWRHEVKNTLRWIVFIVVIPPIIYLLSYGMMFAQGKDWEHFVHLHKQIWHYQTHLEATHPYQSKPWQWVLNLRPVWYYVDYQDTTRADIYAFGNTVVLVGGLVAAILSVVAVSRQSIAAFHQLTFKKAFTKITSSSQLLVVIPYLLLWVPWLFSPRIMFFYHYTPAIPLLCILLAYWLNKLFHYSTIGRYLSILVVILAFIHFVVWYPHWVGIPVSLEIKNALYLHFSNWQ